jgi:hypothetical protein
VGKWISDYSYSNDGYRAIAEINDKDKMIYIFGIGSRKAFGKIGRYGKAHRSMLMLHLLRGEVTEEYFREQMLLEDIELIDINFVIESYRSFREADKRL